MKVSIVIPTKDEPDINSVVKDIRKFESNAEIIIVDKSKYKPDISKNLNAKLVRQSNDGFGDACIIGAKKASGDIIVFIDGDGTYDAKNINDVVKIISSNKADYVIGNRFKALNKKSMNLVNVFGNKILSFLSNKLYNTDISDSQCGLRAITREGFNRLYLTASNFDFFTQMNVEAKKRSLRISEVPINYKPRSGSRTKLNPIGDGLAIAGTMIRLVRDFNPFIVFGLSGLIFLIIGLILCFSILLEFISTNTVSRVPTAILGSLLIISGVIFIGIGLIIDLLLHRLEHC